MRGQHFGFLGTLCVVWISARVAFLTVLPIGITATAMPEKAQASKAPQSEHKNGRRVAPERSMEMFPLKSVVAPTQTYPASRSGLAMHKLAAFAAGTVRVPRAIPPTSVALSSHLVPLSQPVTRRSPSKLNFYIYSFVRQGSNGNSPAGIGQYGGSQSGFVAAYTLGERSGDSEFSILARGAIAHDRLAERELAAGLRWQPLPRLPLTLTAERRFRHARSDAFAVYVAGGKSQIVLPRKFRLDAFAQAGLVSGKDGGPFFDISARAERRLAAIGNAPITIGGGLWGGGQKGILRIDAGPTIGTDIPVGTTRLRINADWRFRIAGDAAPASGPALTLSTSF